MIIIQCWLSTCTHEISSIHSCEIRSWMRRNLNGNHNFDFTRTKNQIISLFGNALEVLDMGNTLSLILKSKNQQLDDCNISFYHWRPGIAIVYFWLSCHKLLLTIAISWLLLFLSCSYFHSCFHTFTRFRIYNFERHLVTIFYLSNSGKLNHELSVKDTGFFSEPYSKV